MAKSTGIAIAIAWPEYIGKQTSSWYDRPMRWLRLNKNFHYKVGHAALILVNSKTGSCGYFDCGRYHAPFQYGRIRDCLTDINLIIKTKAIFSGCKINNLLAILEEVQHNDSFPGVGPLYASYCKINFDSAQLSVKELQDKSFVPFGPFVINGTNCCRFVRTSILAGKPPLKAKLLLQFLWPLCPTPMGNIYCLNERIIVAERRHEDQVTQCNTRSMPTGLYNKKNIKGTLPCPEKPGNVPVNSQWLSGEVIGAWFHLQSFGKDYQITRYSWKGIQECTGIFRLSDGLDFDAELPYRFTYLSHCKKVSISQKGTIFEFLKVS